MSRNAVVTFILFRKNSVLSRRWYILLLPQDYLLLPLGERLFVGGGGVEERSEVMYCIEGDMYIYYKDITCHSYTA